MSTIRNNIIQRILPLFVERGFRISMDEIAQSLSISKRTIYEHFDSKEDLIDQCFNYVIIEVNEEIKLYMYENCNAIEELFPILHENVRKIYTSRFRLIKELERIYPNLYNKYIVQHQENYFNQIKNIIERGKQQGFFLKKINSNIIHFYFPKITTLIMSQSDGIIENYTMKEIFSSIMVPFMRGMLTEKGIIVFNQLVERFIAYNEQQYES